MAGTTVCPDCAAPIAPSGSFKPWCPECGWGLELEERPGPAGLVGDTYARLGEKLGAGLFETLKASPPEALRPKLTAGKLAALALALPVHLSTIALFALGAWCIYVDWFNWFLAGLGAFLMIAAYALAPRLGSAPPHTLARSDAPETYKLVDEVASRLGTPTIDLIAVDPQINASFSRFGLKRTSVLTLGAPLWLSFDGAQKTALVAHELAHQVNGDLARSYWVGGAAATLAHWYDFLTQPYEEGGTIFELVTHYGCLALSVPVRLYLSTLLHLFWRGSQTAEYLADHLGSRVSGTAAFISSDERLAVILGNDDRLFRAIRDFYRQPENIIPAFVQSFDNVPENEMERVRQQNEREKLALDATHPPTHYRSELLRSFPAPAQVARTSEQNAAMNAEFAPLNKAMGLELVRQVLPDL
ncbi:MAG: M48 family metalloprotease [Pseudomonadota bacterium]